MFIIFSFISDCVKLSCFITFFYFFEWDRGRRLIFGFMR
jgi:hypothetical protein